MSNNNNNYNNNNYNNNNYNNNNYNHNNYNQRKDSDSEATAYESDIMDCYAVIINRSPRRKRRRILSAIVIHSSGSDTDYESEAERFGRSRVNRNERRRERLRRRRRNNRRRNTNIVRTTGRSTNTGTITTTFLDLNEIDPGPIINNTIDLTRELEELPSVNDYFDYIFSNH